jgi:hypothetical protein
MWLLAPDAAIEPIACEALRGFAAADCLRFALANLPRQLLRAERHPHGRFRP